MAADLCRLDWVELISDNYNSRHCGQTTKPWNIITNTNSITLRFLSDKGFVRTGFLAVWSPATATPSFTGCDSCKFPFVFGDGTFDTCISVQDVDIQPWCSSGPLLPPTDEGTHLFTPMITKISCSDSDSSCPSSPPQMLITSPDYPLIYPDNADKVN